MRSQIGKGKVCITPVVPQYLVANKTVWDCHRTFSYGEGNDLRVKPLLFPGLHLLYLSRLSLDNILAQGHQFGTL